MRNKIKIKFSFISVVLFMKNVQSLTANHTVKLKAFQLTDNGTPTGNIVASIAVGPMLDVTSGMRPTLPIIDWKSGTPQEIQF